MCFFLYLSFAVEQCLIVNNMEGIVIFSLLIALTALLFLAATDGAASIFLPPYAAVSLERERERDDLSLS